MADAPPRYRMENGASVVDVTLASVEQLFDNRDPAPFRERDLDPGLAEYLVAAAEDLTTHDPLRIVFWLVQPLPPGEIEAACRAHFEYEVARLARVRRRQRRGGWLVLSIAIVAIVLLVSLGEVVARVIGGTIGAGLKEGLVISGWVLMWRPLEVLVYDGLLWRRERRVLRKVLEAPIEVRAGEGPASVSVPR